jgi:hypothetical protein
VEELRSEAVIDRDKRNELLDQIEQNFSVKLLWNENARSPRYRHDVTTHGFFDPENKLTDELRRKIRAWLEGQGWQISRQMVQVQGHAKQVEHVYLAPMAFVTLEVGYHATRRVSVRSIMDCGLLPSTPDRQTTELRLDCEGNIFLCEKLGTPDDAGILDSQSAHWWRAHLAQKNRFNDHNWVILRVEVGRLVGARTYQDIWSKSGIILDNVPQIPADLVRMEYPNAV